MKKVTTIIIFLIFILLAVDIKATDEKIIYIDPGHGGIDGGAYVDGIMEKHLNLEICFKLREYFESVGYTVLLTRDGDYMLEGKKSKDIKKRVELINDSDCCLYLSIHLNSTTMKSLRGAQVFYNKASVEGKKLSEEIQHSLESILLNTTRKAKPIENIYIVDNIKKTGSLIEAGFLSNDIERKLLIDSYYQEQIAYAIYIGTMSYINNSL